MEKTINYSNLTRRPSGEYHAACPQSGPKGDRLRIYRSDREGWWSVFCRQCGMHKFIPIDDASPDARKWSGGKIRSSTPPKTGVPRQFIEATHAALGFHREYFRRRCISDEIIDNHMLGWDEERQRYSIPCFDEHSVYAVQFRASKPNQEPKYLSYRGGFNRVLFNNHVVGGRKLGFAVVVEAPLDALALESIGVPAVAQFDGNSQGSWLEEWNSYLRGAITVVIVADNDKPGMEIALGKKSRIPNSIVITPPDPFKDIGEFLQAGRNLHELFLDVPEKTWLPPK